MRTRVIAAVACCSSAVLLSEVLLTRIFSVTMMYHYAFLVLSITLFGLGSGGIFHFVSDALRKKPQCAPWLALTASLGLPLCLGAILRLPFSPQMFSFVNFVMLASIVVLASLPFFLAGLFISLLYICYRQHVSRLYASDLLGAAGGCLLAVYLLGSVGAILAPLAASVLFLMSAILSGPAISRGAFRIAAVCCAAALVIVPNTGWLELRSVKGHAEPGSLEFEKWNAFSRVAVSSFGEWKFIHIDADAATEIVSSESRKAGDLEKLAGIARLVYEIRRNSTALVIGPGGGREVAAALMTGHEVTGVEINPIIVDDVMSSRYAAYSGDLYRSQHVRIVTADARSFLERTTNQYDVIQANAVDTWAAVSGGGFTLGESYLYTVEAFESYFRHLTDDGVLTLGRWVFNPPQQLLRAVGVTLEVMDRHDPGSYSGRFFLATDPSYQQGGGTPGVLLIKKKPFTDSELQALRHAAAVSHYEVLYDPGQPVSNPFGELIRSKDRRAFYDQYPLNVRPPTDNKPFFFFTLKWKDVLSVWKTSEESRKNNAGLFLLLSAFIIMLSLTTISFLLPMFGRYKTRIRVPAGVFFLCIGLAFMMSESVLIQKSALFLGHPTYSFVTILCSLLIGAGIGSWRTRFVDSSSVGRQLARSSLTLLIVMGVTILVLPAWLNEGFQWPLIWRIVWLALPVTVLGSMLGRLFPLGLKQLDETEIPWAWALNGSASVLGSIVAVLLAMQVGFSAVLWISLGLYGLAGSSVVWWNLGTPQR